MSPKSANAAKLDDIQKMLSGLKGVRRAFYLTKDSRAGLEAIEEQYPAIGPLTVKNYGIMECLKRQHVACIIKDKTFRQPPHATVLLMDEDGEIIGQELMPGEHAPKKKPGVKSFRLGKDFIVFVEKGRGKGAHFVLPPVPFTEVEKTEGVCNVVSSSPSTAGDFFLRKKNGVEDDPKLASIVIGFDLCGL